MSNGEQIAKQAPYEDYLIFVSFSLDGGMFLTIHDEKGSLKVWASEDGEQIAQLDKDDTTGIINDTAIFNSGSEIMVKTKNRMFFFGISY